MSERAAVTPAPQVMTEPAVSTKPWGGPVARIDLLEAIRGGLASWVMLGHFALYLGGATLLRTGGDTLLGKVAFLTINGDVPVCLFMIISGFVICHLIESRREPYGVYIARRFMRLFPALICCFVIGLAVTFWQSSILPGLPWGNDVWLTDQAGKAQLHQRYMLAHIFAHLAMIHGFIPPAWLPDANGAFLGPAWSISTEWQFYLLAPLAVGAARKLPGLALVCAGVVASQVFFSKLRLGTAVDSYNGAFLGFYIQYFFVGGLSYVAWRVVRRSISNAGPAARPLQGVVLCGAGLAFFLLAPVIFGLIRGVSLTPFLPSAILGLWVFFFSCLCQIMIAPACLEARLVEKIGCSRVAMFLGRISYSIYLVHFPLGVLLVRLSRPIWGIPRPAYVIFFLIAGTLMTYACAAVLYHYVEAPAIAWAKKRFGEK